jgi:type I restriction enzyme S subunit
MSFPRYSAYKPSGVEWLGEVPEHWSIIRLKNVLQCRITDGPHTTPEFIDEGVPFLSVDGIQDGELRFDGCRFISEKDHEEFSRKAQPVRDDILMGKAASTGKIARVKTDFTFSIWSPLALIRVDSQLSSPSFYEQALKSAISQAQIDVLCTSNTQKNISMDDIPRLVMTRPTIEEQLAIATFLDHETAKIDALIAEQQRLIELLQEKRQAVISHAVTKGLNPDAPMKDSGVEWLGEVPEHWDVTPLKYLSEIKAGFAFKSDEFTDSGVPVLRIGDIGRDGTVDFCDAKYLAAEALDDHSDVLVKHGDIVMAMTGATIGKAARYTAAEPALLNQRVCIFRARHPESQPYVWFALATHYYAEYLTITAFGGAQPNISDSELVACHVPIPPVKERVDIAMRLSEDMANMVVLETEAQQAISLLQERRSALISAAVTGQIDVRGLVAEAEAA